MANPATAIPGANAQAADKAARQNNALWYTFSGIGRAYLVKRGSVAASDADVSSVHGYSTIEQAYTNPNVIDSASQLTISDWDKWASLPAGGGTVGIVETVNINAPAVKGQAPTISTPQNPTTAATKTALSNIWSGVPWLRIGEITLGLLLIAVGVAKMTDSVPVATKIAKALS